MSKVTPCPLREAAALRQRGGYTTEWSAYYGASRSLVDKATAVNLADAHVAYLQKRDAEILREQR
ncbi:MAG: hypothetical protein E6Q77_00315 [Rhizobium sp.]|nr:MAG: hypothetical protein E6Q77_00315 [Rhizobium sp.]